MCASQKVQTLNVQRALEVHGKSLKHEKLYFWQSIYLQCGNQSVNLPAIKNPKSSDFSRLPIQN